jgi:hypothetical protein
MPAAALCDHGQEVVVASPETLDKSFDLVVIPSGPNTLLAESRARHYGVPIVYDMQDALDVPLDCPVQPLIARYRPVVERTLAEAALVSVTTERLADALLPYRGGKPIAVHPNLVDPALFPRRPRASERVRIGWAGTSVHLGDLLPVLDAVIELQATHDFDFVCMGLCTPAMTDLESWRSCCLEAFSPAAAVACEAVASRLARVKHLSFMPYVPPDTYPAALAALDLDLGLAPLDVSPFNRCKSPVKFYEYALAGTLGLTSIVSPYADELPTRWMTPRRGWVRTISTLLALSSAERTERADAQREWVIGHRHVGLGVADRIAAYRSLVASPRPR